MNLVDRMLGALFGLVVGDALGVPVEFRGREELKKHPVVDMRGHGTHDQPRGTWSDDTTMALCIATSLTEKGYDPLDQMLRFQRWLREAYLTPHGVVFDVGNATRAAIERFGRGLPQAQWGGREERDNGNGSLMRLLPLSLYLADQDTETIVARSQEASALTHAHPRSQLCCAYFSLLVRELLMNQPLPHAMDLAAAKLTPFVTEEEEDQLQRLLTGDVLQATEDEIRGSGYVLDCLEASLWCCHHEYSFEGAVLRAVNLGEDTDTTGAVTGALAGLIHGQEGIPPEWFQSLARRYEIEQICRKLLEKIQLG